MPGAQYEFYLALCCRKQSNVDAGRKPKPAFIVTSAVPVQIWLTSRRTMRLTAPEYCIAANEAGGDVYLYHLEFEENTTSLSIPFTESVMTGDISNLHIMVAYKKCS